jgi:hypothetical protein
LAWLKTIDDNLRIQPKHFWKYISKFKRNDQAITQIEVGDQIITEPQSIAETFANHFRSIFYDSQCGNPCSISPNSSDFTSSDVLNIPHISLTDVTRAISRLRSAKCVGTDEIPNFIIKGCSEIFTPLLHHIFNLSLLTGSFPGLWKQAAVVPIFKKGNSALVTNYRPIYLLNNFSKIF